MSTPRTSRYRLVVTGRLPDSLSALLADRFGPAAVVVPDAGGTVVDVEVDRSGLRALLTLLWDVDQDVQSICRCPPGSQ